MSRRRRVRLQWVSRPDDAGRSPQPWGIRRAFPPEPLQCIPLDGPAGQQPRLAARGGYSRPGSLARA